MFYFSSLRKLLLPALLLLAVTCAQPALAQDTTGTLMHDGLERSYTLHLPDGYNDDEPLPLVLALHPTASSGEWMAILTGLNDAADERNFIAAYPQSYEFAWNDGRETGPAVSGTDDVGFINALVEHLTEAYAVDPERVYLAGYAGGGTMTYLAACQTHSPFAGVAVVGALLWDYHVTACPEEGDPIPMLIMRGSADPFYLEDGRDFTVSSTLSLENTLNLWGGRNGCDMEAGQQVANVTLYSDCAAGSRLAYYEVEGGGGNWPRTGNYHLNQFGVDATEIVIGFFAGDEDWAAAQPEPFTGQARTYNAFVPSSYNPADRTPLVVVLHGRPDNGAGIAYISDMNTIAEREGFVAVYPDGLENEWNYTRAIPMFGNMDTADDAQFLSDMVDDLAQDLNIDRERVYVTGFSNGGFMTQRLACEARDQYAAFAVVGATAFLGMIELCEDKAPAPILFMHGTEDVSIPWEGIPRSVGGEMVYLAAPMLRTIEFWIAHNGCDVTYEETQLEPQGDSPETSVHLLEFDGCPENSALDFYAIFGGGHNWPGVPGRLREDIAGNVNMDIHASQVIWDFFSEFTQEE